MPNVYKIVFYNDDKLYELYAKQVLQSGMYGFIEIEQIVFGENSTVVVDPSEEKLKNEFGHVIRSYIPMHNIIRIDEVPKQDTAKIHNKSGNQTQSNIKTFPGLLDNKTS